MTEKWVSYVIFAVRLPGYEGWRPECIEAKLEQAAEAITNKYPYAFEFRIITHGGCDKSIFKNNLEEMLLGYWQIIQCGWYYDALEDRWLAPDEEANRPSTPVLSATVNMNAEPPEHGWWYLHLKFSPVFDNGNNQLAKDCLLQEIIQCDIHCSDVFDPLEDIKNFVSKIKNKKDARVMIDEEGQFVHMSVWCTAQDFIYLRIESLLYEKDYCYDFHLDKVQFVSEFEKMLADFREYGGWGAWRYLDFEEEDDDGA